MALVDSASFLSILFSFGALMKTVSYAASGFDYRPYAAPVIAGVLASIPGAAVGTYLAGRFREDQFRLAFRLLMTLLALRTAQGLDVDLRQAALWYAVPVRRESRPSGFIGQ